MQRDTSIPGTQRPANAAEGDGKQRTATALKQLKVPRAVTVARLAQSMNAGPIELMKQLMRAGVMANINQVIDFDTAAAVVPAFGFHAVPLEEALRETKDPKAEMEDPTLLMPRPPVVAVLGHVDHGKTTLLDSIRKSKVAEREAGGITQHIGAYQVEYRGQQITFLDTPGHEAFTAMRARGAEATDIAVLVVAADDGVMPQTSEAIDHIKAAGVPIVVAINKIDRPDADPERVKRQLSDHGLLIEEWGGNVVAVPVSAKTGQGLEDLLESILVVAEVSELKANPSRLARGVVVEAKLDKSRGPVATVLVKTGTLNVGDHMVVGAIRGKVKALVDDAGRRIRKATPAMPVEVLGLSELPAAGNSFIVAESEREARALAEERQQTQKAAGPQLTLEEMFNRIRAGEAKELNLIVKADVQGSVEAVRDALNRLATEKAQVRIVHAASGTITESDAFLAVASQAIIIGFNTSLEPGARHVTEVEGVEIRFYDIIYTLLDDIKNTLEGLVKPALKEVVEGHAVVRAVFSRRGQKSVAGLYVTDGRVVRNGSARVLRNGTIVHDGAVASLRRIKEDAREVAAGFECGMLLADFDEFLEGDIIEVRRQERAAV
ncbi:MAG: translation initiation factor IF-2 [Chloroflexi bacterium]|nr:translation initiation factor IF-2 [Chloroflexota bacterium]